MSLETPRTDAGPALSGAPRQPLLHDLVTSVAAPVVALSDPGGDIRPAGAQGVYAADLRWISRCELTVDGAVGEPIATATPGADSAEFVVLVRHLGNPGADPTVWIRRTRTVTPAGCAERLHLVNQSDAGIRPTVSLLVAADLAPIETVKMGGRPDAVAVDVTGDRVTLTAGGAVAVLTAADARIDPTGTGLRLSWTPDVPARSSVTVGWELTVDDPEAAVVAARRRVVRAPVVTADDRRLAPLVARSLADLQGLQMAAAGRPDETFLAAGSPWYLTLFGRDSLWAARMLLPTGTDLALGTLRTLAALQGTAVDPATAEEPGKIPHEVRRSVFAHGDTVLPALYYGTIDATPLWICLLADAWRWGLPAAEVESLLPALDRALGWLEHHGDSDGDGFLEYIDRSGHGLANQGWKDSGDAVRFRDGRVADGPIALAEVQGYAYEAAVKAADLLDAFGRPGATRWRSWAAALADRFRETFWLSDDLGRYPAIALDGDKVAVDAPASNMGHLLATGILSAAEAADVAARLVDPSMSSGFGLRTMSDRTDGYSPLSYHCGSVWPHDTAIAVHGLVSAGLTAAAAALADGLLAAGAAFENRFPELYAGFGATEIAVPVPYPASCRPQAWSAAAAVMVVQGFLGVRPDVPAGVVELAPAPGLGAIRVQRLRIAGEDIDISVDADGRCTWSTPPAGITVRVAGG
ncbi:glycogen debranching N-terminal domain-containing protein [Nakamurella deserti]|uniref:amylo-alpha-1,6-glucosidase n=1 Tax=Nakamurella deserti TaxID=2164074 RepID=UPI00197B3ECA|nr:glycogen debranching N-terminal domain-containing protein [Nakamurella deserti]